MKILQWIWKGIKTWKEEVIGIPVALAMFLASATLIRMIDQEAGAYDTGYLHIIPFTLVRAMFFVWFAWLAVRWIFPRIWNFYQKEFEFDFNTITAWQKLKISLCIFFAFYFSLVLLGVNP